MWHDCIYRYASFWPLKRLVFLMNKGQRSGSKIRIKSMWCKITALLTLAAPYRKIILWGKHTNTHIHNSEAALLSTDQLCSPLLTLTFLGAFCCQFFPPVSFFSFFYGFEFCCFCFKALRLSKPKQKWLKGALVFLYIWLVQHRGWWFYSLPLFQSQLQRVNHSLQSSRRTTFDIFPYLGLIYWILSVFTPFRSKTMLFRVVTNIDT